jgi:O-antigen/teichoic acid export membrane protein
METPVREPAKKISWPERLRSRFFPQGSLRSSLIFGAFWSLMGAAFSRGFTLISSIVIARLLGKAGYGKWGLVLSTVYMFAQFASFGVTLTATKHVAELKRTDPHRAGRVLCLILIVGLISLTAMSLLCLGTSRLLAYRLYNVPELSVPLIFASTMLFGMVGTLMLRGALAGFEDFRCIARINLVQGVVFFMAAVSLTWRLGLVGTVVGSAISHGTAMVLCLLAIFKRSRAHNMRLTTQGIWQERSLIWSYAAPSFLTGAVTGPATVLSQAIVANISGGLAGLGGYQASSRWNQVVLFIPQAVRQVTLPMLSRLKGENDYHRFVKALWANIGLNGGIALVGAIPIMILSPWLLGLYGAGFHQDWDMMVILAGSGIFQAINDVAAQVTACMEKMWWRFAICLVWGITLLGGSYLLVPILGVRGYVWSLAATVVIHMLLNSTAAFILVRRACSKLDAEVP